MLLERSLVKVQNVPNGLVQLFQGLVWDSAYEKVTKGAADDLLQSRYLCFIRFLNVERHRVHNPDTGDAFLPTHANMRQATGGLALFTPPLGVPLPHAIDR